MSTEVRLARLGLLHLVDDTEALKAALEAKAKALRGSDTERQKALTKSVKSAARKAE